MRNVGSFKACVVAAVAAVLSGFGASGASADPGRPVSWTGFTIGVNGAYAWSDIDFPNDPPYPAGPPRPSLSGGLVGLQLGYNVNAGGVVLGGVLDVGFGNLSETVRDGNYITETMKISRLTTARALIGLPMDRFLPYLTGGYAWAASSYSMHCPDQAAAPFGGCSFPGPRDASANFTLSGWTYGAGVKYAWGNNLILGAEVLRVNFQDEGFSMGSFAKWPVNDKTMNGDMTLAKISVDFRF